MNEPNSEPTERRYGEHAVLLIGKAGDLLRGTSYALYPVDEPPLIEVPSIGRRWHREVWESHGWRVTEPAKES